ncbi:hypothetical protein ABK040_014465 [Willaertia magna]
MQKLYQRLSRHLIICVNETTIYTIGQNYSSQLGIGKKFKNLFTTNKFKLVKWNEKRKLLVKQIAECSSSTVILTKCNKIFITQSYLQKKEYTFQFIKNIEEHYYIGSS